MEPPSVAGTPDPEPGDGSESPAESFETAAPAPTPHRPRLARRVWDRVGPPGWTLRSRLVALLVALLAGVSLTIGVISTLALQHYLVGQLDDKVESAAYRTLHLYQAQQDPPTSQSHNTFGFGPGQVEGTVMAVLTNGKLAGDVLVLTTTGQTGTVAGNTAVLATVPADTHDHTRDLGGDLGEYRLRAVPVGSGTVVLTGLSMKSVKDATFRASARRSSGSLCARCAASRPRRRRSRRCSWTAARWRWVSACPTPTPISAPRSARWVRR
jgi:two-component system OmpR family sensor kinase